MCDYIGYHFGAPYPDARCIDGYLWDEDSGCQDPEDECIWLYDKGGEDPCPICNMSEYNQRIINSLDWPLEE